MSAYDGCKPTAGPLEDGRIGVYIGDAHKFLPRDAALRLFVELGDALDLPTPERVRFLEWVAARRVLPIAQDVMTEFNVSRATACRWLATERETRTRSAA